MRALTALATGALLLASCETAFVGRAPGGRYALVEVDGNAPPFTLDPADHCPTRILGGHFDLDAVARRFEMVIDRTGHCSPPRDLVERGSYLRRGGRLELEAAQPDGATRALVATESGSTIALEYDELRLRFRQVAPKR
ncbi:MAG TPA: hypothetical protein VEW25_02600 [Allosphingosinicella sp.]|nr:hypothetical protein [Allosphingosinicella sp.]